MALHRNDLYIAEWIGGEISKFTLSTLSINVNKIVAHIKLYQINFHWLFL